MKTHANQGFSLEWWSALHAVPAFVAGSAVVLFLLAALLPLAVFVVLVAFHVVLTTFIVLPQTKSRSERALLLCDHVSELSFLLFALAVSTSLDPSSQWHQGLSSVVRALVTLTAFIGVVLPKMQILRMTLLSARSPITLRSALALLSAAAVLTLLSPLLLQRTVPHVAMALLERLTAWNI